MTGPDRFEVTPVAYATLDGEGRLLAADPAIGALNERWGGAIGEPLAAPAIAAVVRLCQRLGVELSRDVTVADEEGDLALRVTARPQDGGVRIAVGGWENLIARPLAARRTTAAASDNAALRWECDAGLRLTRLFAGRVPPLDLAVPDLIGRPVGVLFDGFDPARAAPSGEATLTGMGTPVAVTVAALRNGEGAVVGWRGTAIAANPPATAAVATPSLPAAFTAGLDRALRRPLAQIVANADSIAQGSDGPIAPDYADYAADIAGAGRHLLSLVDDLVDLEAVERPDFALAPEAIDLAEVARRAAALLAVRAETAGISIARPVPEASLPARGDFRRALQIAVNLVTNAVRYAPPGSAVVVAIAERDGRALLSVADRGKGIAPADQARVFAKFERVDASEPGGNGLGLYIARRLARAMSGELTLESKAGEGARFTLSLPMR